MRHTMCSLQLTSSPSATLTVQVVVSSQAPAFGTPPFPLAPPLHSGFSCYHDNPSLLLLLLYIGRLVRSTGTYTEATIIGMLIDKLNTLA